MAIVMTIDVEADLSSYSVAEARNALPRLIDQALDGERVVITRHGKPVAELRPPAPRSAEERALKHAEYAARRDARPPLPVSSVLLIDDMYEERR